MLVFLDVPRILTMDQTRLMKPVSVNAHLHHPDNGGASVSPSLRASQSQAYVRAYEVKFLLTEAVSRKVEAIFEGVLQPDPHADRALGGMYTVTSLACDGPDFHVYFRDRKARNRKYRVRRYGSAESVFLERKHSRKGRVRKRRVEANIGDLLVIGEDHAAHASQNWFVRELRMQDLSPVCRMRYMRRAIFGASAQGPVRVTFDRDIVGSVSRAWSMEQQGEERSLLEGLVICEFKFNDSMPTMLRDAMDQLGLEATGVSKYRTCVRAFATTLGLDLPDEPVAISGISAGARHA